MLNVTTAADYLINPWRKTLLLLRHSSRFYHRFSIVTFAAMQATQTESQKQYSRQPLYRI